MAGLCDPAIASLETQAEEAPDRLSFARQLVRAVVFDEVSGAPDPRPFETGPAHGSSSWLYLDVDSATLRSLGQFFLDLADQADAPEP